VPANIACEGGSKIQAIKGKAITTMVQALEFLALAIVISLCLSLVAAHAMTGVPTMSASSAENADIIALLKLADLPDQAVIYDLGCGWGAQLIALSRAFPHAQIRGIELSPFPYFVALIRTRNLANVVVQSGDFFKTNLGDAQAVTCYLMPSAMRKLAIFLDSVLEPATPVVALTFWFRDRQAAASREGKGLRGAAALYFWPALKGF
jgi:O-methyltransferase domain